MKKQILIHLCSSVILGLISFHSVSKISFQDMSQNPASLYEKRCRADALSSDEAIERVKFLRKCYKKIKLRNRPISPLTMDALQDLWLKNSNSRPQYPIIISKIYGITVSIAKLSNNLRESDACEEHLSDIYTYNLSNTCTSY